MSILNVNQIQPVGSGQTVTISATNISAGSATVTAGTFSGGVTVTSGNLTGITSVSTSNLTVNGNAYPATGPLSNRNLIINGAMQVAQRGTTITDVGVDTYTLDRWKQFAQVGGMTGRSTVTQETITDLEGFRTALKLQVTTAETPAATESYGLNTRLEAQDILGLDIGGSNSKSLTLSFWAKAPTGNGTFCAGIVMAGGGHYFEEVTIGTTWSRHVVNIPATTTSSNATTATGTATGIEVQITLMAGSSVDDLTNGVWQSSTSSRCTSNQSNFYSSTSNNLWVTGVQLEVGSVATPFEHRSYGQELSLCQRYYYKSSEIRYLLAARRSFDSGQAVGTLSLPTTMRDTPTVTDDGNFQDSAYAGTYTGDLTWQYAAPDFINFVTANSVDGGGILWAYGGTVFCNAEL